MESILILSDVRATSGDVSAGRDNFIKVSNCNDPVFGPTGAYGRLDRIVKSTYISIPHEFFPITQMYFHVLSIFRALTST